MAKTDTQTAVRPPRPARRVRLEAGESGSSTQVQSTTSASAVEPMDAAEPEHTESAQAPSVQAESQQLSRTGEGSAEPVVPFNFFEPRGVIRPRAAEIVDGLPVATLEGPSMGHLDLTPSPVPRVSLVPATGVVDISLIPGPNTVGSRNLPTLAARHALGRPRQRGAAPAVTFPPPSGPPQQAFSAAPKPSRRARSSQREVVLGLGIGIGLSVLLAVGGQALLDKRGPSIATKAPLQTAIPGLLPSAAPAAERLLPGAPARALEGNAPSSDGLASGAAPAEAAAPTSAPPARPTAEVSSRRRAAARSRAASPRAGSAKRPTTEPGAPNAEKAPAGPALPDKTPLSPSESAGLGLDLPF